MRVILPIIATCAMVLSGCASIHKGHHVDRIAFGSCAREFQPQPIWNRIIEKNPDVFLFIGDNIYADTLIMSEMREKYDQLNAKPGFRRLRATCPVLATWDDHDFGVNDGGADYPMRSASKREFVRAFNIPIYSPMRWRRGVHSAHLFGDSDHRVQIILLDTRYFRGPLQKRDVETPESGRYIPTTDTSVTMLGENQWRWLEQQLRVPARIRIIASSIQVVAEEQGYEKWANIPHERDRLFDMIRRSSAEGIFFISGDRHIGELSKLDGMIDYPLYDLTSSGLNCASDAPYPEENRHRIQSVGGDNFGLITIDWGQVSPEVCLEIHHLDGEPSIQHCFPLSELRIPSS